MEILTSLNIAGLVLALLFNALILSKKGKQVRDYLLAFFILLLGIFLLIKYMFQLDLFYSYPIIIYLDFIFWVALGPTLYLYTLVTIRGENYLRWSYLYTLIPAVIVFICFSEFIFGNPADLFYEEENNSKIAHVGIYIWLFNSLIFYILTIIAIRKHQKRLKDLFSYSKSINLNWLYYLSHGFGIFIVFIDVRDWIEYLFSWNFPFDNYGISLGIVFIYIFGIGFYGYRQKGIFDNFDLKDVEKDKLNQNENKVIHKRITDHQYKKSGLNKEEAHLILSNLESLMISDQPYLDSELNLAILSSKINISKHKLSQAINEYLNKSFFDFVNDYRIRNVKDLLSDSTYNHLKIMSLAYDSGFNSKSTFYKLFKIAEGITPVEYQLRVQKIAG